MAIQDAVSSVAKVGLLCLVGAIFNSLYTRQDADEFFGRSVRGSMLLALARELIWTPPKTTGR